MHRSALFVAVVHELPQPSSVHLMQHLPTLYWQAMNSKSATNAPSPFLGSRKLMPWHSWPPSFLLTWKKGAWVSAVASYKVPAEQMAWLTNSWNTCCFSFSPDIYCSSHALISQILKTGLYRGQPKSARRTFVPCSQPPSCTLIFCCRSHQNCRFLPGSL